MTRRILVAIAVLLVVGLAIAFAFRRVQYDFLHVIGVLPRTPGTTYNFWSGFGSDISEFAVIGALLVLYRKHECHVNTCHRLHWKTWVDPDGHTHALCRKHHPHSQPTEAELAALIAREQNPVTT